MRIFKIGGSVVKSKQDFDNLIQKTIKLTLEDERGNFFVFSAFAKTSAKLRQMAILASVNEINLATKIKLEVIDFHKSLIDYSNLEFFETLDKDLSNFIDGLAITSDLSKSVLDKILHFGENLAINLITSSLQKQNIDFYFLDAKSYLVTDSNFGEANPIIEKIERNLANLKNQISSHNLIITQGFIGFYSNLSPTTMGFESSNLTATLLADALNIKEINIISDVPALLSADPSYFSKTKLIEQLSYAEAKALANFGLKLLYGRMIDIAEKKQISIKYSDLSQDYSTLISYSSNVRNKFVITNFDLACIGKQEQSIYTFTNGNEAYSFVQRNQSPSSISYEYKLITLFGFEKTNLVKLYENSTEIVNFSFNESGFAALVVKEFDANKVIQQIEATLL